MENNKPQRIYFGSLSSDGATIAKVIATFCVVLVHSDKLFKYMEINTAMSFYLNGFRAIAACGVPVFFLLSGYFLTLKDQWDWKTNMRKKVRSLLVPYCLFILFYAVISFAGSLVFPSFFDNFKELTVTDWFYKLIGIPFVEGPQFYGPLWFIRDLFILNVFAFLLVPLVKKIPAYILMPAMALIFFLPLPDSTRYSIPFFLVGMFFGTKKRLPVLSHPALIIPVFGIAFILPMAIVSVYTMKVAVLLMSVFVVSISQILAKNSTVTGYAKRLIVYSFPTYLLHEYPMTTMMRLIALKGVPFPAPIIIYFVAPFFIVALCLLVGACWRRFLPKTFAVFFGGRK